MILLASNESAAKEIEENSIEYSHARDQCNRVLIEEDVIHIEVSSCVVQFARAIQVSIFQWHIGRVAHEKKLLLNRQSRQLRNHL